MESGHSSRPRESGNTTRAPHAREGRGDPPIVAQINPLPISQREIHMVLDALGADLARLFGEAEA
jgi:hypothetical protein